MNLSTDGLSVSPNGEGGERTKIKTGFFAECRAFSVKACAGLSDPSRSTLRLCRRSVGKKTISRQNAECW
jgi:hypothetical protein